MLSNVMSMYSQLTKSCKINNLGPPFTYFEADEIKSNIYVTDLIELDITAAFPTICKFYFGEQHQLVKNIFQITEKKQRNIYIATTLTEQSKIDGKNYLQELNLWCKILILGYIYSQYENIDIIEYKKDGVLFKGDHINTLSSIAVKFNEFIKEQNVIFHKTVINQYMRINKTSIFDIAGSIDIKGGYKSMPDYLALEVLPLLLINSKIYDHKTLNEIKQKYTYKYSQIVIKSGIKEYIDKYYRFKNNTFLDCNGKLTKNIQEIYIQSYLSYIIYPALSLLRIKIK
jgi:hypothetical protein